MIRVEVKVEGYVPNPFEPAPQYVQPTPSTMTAEGSQPVKFQSEQAMAPAGGLLDNRPVLKALLAAFLPVLLGLFGTKTQPTS